jgi:alanyl-tRNA synthetase
MPADRIYYTKPSQMNFEGIVVASSQVDGRWHTMLDRTAFYPTSGGQLFDTGKINGIEIVEVIETDVGDIAHISVQPVGVAGDKAAGLVDAPRRQMHRQQHTAQHILSYAFVKLFSLETVSVHLGEEYGAVELETTALSDEQLAEATALTRRIITENTAITILFVTGEEAAKLPLRKQTAREGAIRVIKIGEYDWSACGGTHCERTAEVGSFVILGVSKMRGRMLVTFLAGDQLTKDYEQRRDVTIKLSQLFSCGIADIPANVTKLADESRETRKMAESACKELVQYRAVKTAEHATIVGAYKLYVGSDEGLDPKLAALYGSYIAQLISGVAVLIGESRVIISCAPESGCKAGELAKFISAGTGGRGGGNDSSAQVGNIPSDKTVEVKAIVSAFLTSM